MISCFLVYLRYKELYQCFCLWDFEVDVLFGDCESANGYRSNDCIEYGKVGIVVVGLGRESIEDAKPKLSHREHQVFVEEEGHELT